MMMKPVCMRILKDGLKASHNYHQGKLEFGPWEQVFYGEFDGRQSKRVLVKVLCE
jgi:thiamine phosphate synthase YjbQ (UPF0047 family)